MLHSALEKVLRRAWSLLQRALSALWNLDFRIARDLRISSADLSYLQSVDLSHALQILPTECMEHGVMMRHSLFTLSIYKYCQDHRSKVSLSQDSWRQSWHEKQLYCSQYSLTNDTSQYSRVSKRHPMGIFTYSYQSLQICSLWPIS